MNMLRCVRQRNASTLSSHVFGRHRSASKHNAIVQARWLASRPPRSLRSSDTSSSPPRDRYAASQRSKEEHDNTSRNAPPSQEEDGEPPRPPRATLRDVGRSLLTTLSFFFVGHYIATYHYAITFPYGPSMLPTFAHSGDCVVISRHYRNGRDTKVGDLVTAIHPLFTDTSAVLKRVIGMPGDFVWVPEGRIGEWEWEFGDEGRGRYVQVPRGHCWLSGDNWRHSRDSRHYGAVPLGLVTGKVVWRILPFGAWGPTVNTLEEVAEEMLL